MSRSKKQTLGRKRKEPRPCKVPGCPHFASVRGLCQSHNKQQLKGQELRPIRPYRTRTRDTVKVAGIKVTSGCAERLQRKAEKETLSLSAAIADILEHWDDKDR